MAPLGSGLMGSLDMVRVPRSQRAPLSAILRRIGLAFGLIVFVAFVVRLSGDGYVDVTDDPISFLDALYYASVTVTTTGYGDITAVSEGARLAAMVLITPARVLFLILVVGTTVEVLTDQSKEIILKRRWRQRVKNHIVICGFGSTGQAAAADLISRGIQPSEIVAVDISPKEIQEANRLGLTGVLGDATRNEVLEQAAIGGAKAVVVSPNRDDTAVLVTLTIRQHNPEVHIVAGVREQENLHLLRQGGANEVIDATAAVGRMLGLGTESPGAVRVLDDLLAAGVGLELMETTPQVIDEQLSTPEGATLVAVIREGVRLPPAETSDACLIAGDRLVVLRETNC